MKIYPILCMFFVFSSWSIHAQKYTDFIVAKDNDTIACKITLVNDLNIFYEYNPKKKKIVKTYIPKLNVKSFYAEDENVVLKISEKSEAVSSELIEEEEIEFAEEDGIIYAAIIDDPPRFFEGQITLYKYLESKVRVYPRDTKVFRDHSVSNMYVLSLLESGEVKNAEVFKSVADYAHFSYESKFLEEEIRRVFEEMPNWIPAQFKGKNIPLTIYIPLKFIVGYGSIEMRSSKNVFSFHGRD